ncbi:MAG: hypothetical protein LBH73_03415 [Spirochaetaceae bacterium]|nr:hypothetical protein [Spirochaetaceae bacterium]
MFSSDFFRLIKQVVFSWQVVGVTLVLIIYLSLVFYVARLYHRPKRYGFSAPKKNRKNAETVSAAPVQVDEDEEDLSLEGD